MNTPTNDVTPEESESSFSDGYKKAYEELLSKGMNPRKARRYLDSIAKRNIRKFVKGVKKNGRTNSIPVQSDVPSTETYAE